eukprot:PhF_6_TR36298/c0_g1_i1/m.52975
MNVCVSCLLGLLANFIIVCSGGRVVFNAVDFTAPGYRNRHEKWCTSQQFTSAVTCVTPHQYYGLTLANFLGHTGLFFSDPTMGTSGGLFFSNLDGSNLEYFDLPDLAYRLQINDLVVMWASGLHSIANDFLLICDSGNHKIRQASMSDGIIIGSGTAGDVSNVAPDRAQLNDPADFAFFSSTRTLYINDRGNKKIKTLTITPPSKPTGNYKLSFIRDITTFTMIPLGITYYKQYVIVSFPDASQVVSVNVVRGDMRRLLDSPMVRKPQALWMDCGEKELLIADGTRNEVVRYRFRTGTTEPLSVPGVTLRNPSGFTMTPDPMNPVSTSQTKWTMYVIAGADGQIVTVNVSNSNSTYVSSCAVDPKTRSRTKTSETSQTLTQTMTQTFEYSLEKTLTRTDKRDREPSITNLITKSRTTPESTASKESRTIENKTSSVTKSNSITPTRDVTNPRDSFTASWSQNKTNDVPSQSRSLCDDFVVYLNTTELKSTDLANEQSPEEARSIVLTLLCDTWKDAQTVSSLMPKCIDVREDHSTENGLPFRRSMILPLFQAGNYRISEDNRTLTIVLRSDFRYEIIRAEVWHITIEAGLVARQSPPFEATDMRVFIRVPCDAALYEETQQVSGLIVTSVILTLLASPFNSMDATSTTLVVGVGWMTSKGLVRTATFTSLYFVAPPVWWFANENVNVVASNCFIFLALLIIHRVIVFIGVTWNELPDFLRTSSTLLYPYFPLYIGWYLHHSTLLHAFRLIIMQTGDTTGVAIGVCVAIVIIGMSAYVMFWHVMYCECEYKPYNILKRLNHWLEHRHPYIRLVVPYLFYSGSWGPNDFYDRHSCFMMNHENQARTRSYVAVPLLLSSMVAIMGGWEPEKQDVIAIHQICICIVYLVGAIYYFTIRPLRTIVLNVLTGAIYLLLWCVAAFNAHSAYGLDCTALIGKNEILKFLGAVLFLRTVYWIACTFVELWFVRMYYWPRSAVTEDIGYELDNTAISVDDETRETVSVLEKDMADRISGGSSMKFLRSTKSVYTPSHHSMAPAPIHLSPARTTSTRDALLMPSKGGRRDVLSQQRPLSTEEDVRNAALGLAVLPAHLRPK